MSDNCSLLTTGRILRSSSLGLLKRKPNETTECAKIHTKRRKRTQDIKSKDVKTANHVGLIEESVELSDCKVKPEDFVKENSRLKCDVQVVLNRSDVPLCSLKKTDVVVRCAPIENHVHQIADNFIHRPVQPLKYVLACSPKESCSAFTPQVTWLEGINISVGADCNKDIPNNVSNDFSDSIVNNILNCYIGLSRKHHEMQPNESIWVDAFKPQNTTDIIGNKVVVEQLFSWLKEWVQKWQKESSCSAFSTGNDPDFEYSSDSNDSLLNCLLLFGPQGIGKTSLVYALAQQMGFTVLEINPSSLRSGRIITAQLREATLSHHVEGTSLPDHASVSNSQSEQTLREKPIKNHSLKEAACEKESVQKSKKSIADFFTSSRTKSVSVKTSIDDGDVARVSDDKSSSAPKKQRQNKSSLLNYFSPVQSQENQKTTVEEPRTLAPAHDRCVDVSDGDAKKLSEKQKVKKSEKPSSEKCLPLTTRSKIDEVKNLSFSNNTIILIDDVDVVFEEDEGFWSTVNTFIRTTKKPVILTASRSLQDVTSNLSSDIEVLHMARIDSATVAESLKSACASKSIGIELNDIKRLVAFCGEDIRRSLLQLQFCYNSFTRPLIGNQNSLLQYLKECSVLDASRAVDSLHGAENLVVYDNFPEMISLPSERRNPRSLVAVISPKKKPCDLDVSWLSDEKDDDEESEHDTTGEEKVTCPHVKASLKHVADVLDCFALSDVFLKHSSNGVSVTRHDRHRLWLSGLPACSEYSDLVENFPLTDLVACTYVLSARSADKELASLVRKTSQIDKMSWVKPEKCEYDSVQEKYDLVMPSIVPVHRLNNAAFREDYCSSLRTMHKTVEMKKNTSMKRGGRFLHYFDSVGLDVNMDAIKYLCNSSFKV